MNNKNLTYKVIISSKSETYTMITDTMLQDSFYGTLVNNTNGKFFFELKESGGLIIIPYKDIEFMAPIQETQHEEVV